MGFNFKDFKKFDFNSVLKFATIDLLNQKKLVLELVVLSCLLVIFLVLGFFTLAFPITALYFLLTPNLGIFTIIPVLLTFVFFVLTLLTGVYFSYRLISFALSSAKKKVQKFSVKLAVKIIFSGIVTFFVSLFSLYEIKLLSFAIIGVILFLVGIILTITSNGNLLLLFFGVISIVIAFILLFIYYIILIRNALRLSFSSFFVVEKGMGAREAVRASWDLTGGKALIILILQFILIGVTWILQQIIFIVLSLFATLFGASFPTEFNLIFLISFVLGFIVLFVFFIVLSELVLIFGQVAIYSQISPKKR